MKGFWATSWDKIKRLFGRGHEFISIVVLLNAPRQFSEEGLRAATERAWGVKFGGDKEPKNFVVIRGHVRFVQVEGHFFQILSVARPYIEKRDEFAALLSDLGARTAVVQHRAWMSVDHHRFGRGRLSKNERYAATGKMVAELLGDDCLAVCVPDENVVVATTTELSVRLRKMKSVQDLVS